MILITGSAGFIGKSLVDQLVPNYKIIGIDDLSSGHRNNIINHKNYKFYKGDCADEKILKKIKNIKIIIHLAGQSSGEKSFEDPKVDFEKNVLTTVSLLNFANKCKCKHFIFASSMSVYGNSYKNKIKESDKTDPISFYGISKLNAEKYIKKYSDKKINYTILRLFNVYGSNQKLGNLKQGIIRIYLSQILNSKSLIIKGSKNRYRDFIHINDLTKYFELIINNKLFFNQTFNVGTGKKTTIQSLVSLIKKEIKFKFKIKYIKGTKDDQFGVVADPKKLIKYSKYKCKIGLNKGLKEMVQNIK